MHVKDLTTNELKALIRQTVLEAIEEFLPDPDAGLPLRPEIKQSLLNIRSHRELKNTGISSEEVARRLGLDR